MNLEAAAPCQTSNMLKRRGQREKETITISLLGVSPRQLATHRAEEHLVQHSKKKAEKRTSCSHHGKSTQHHPRHRSLKN
jgi:hypothetical protein